MMHFPVARRVPGYIGNMRQGIGQTVCVDGDNCYDDGTTVTTTPTPPTFSIPTSSCIDPVTGINLCPTDNIPPIFGSGGAIPPTSAAPSGSVTSGLTPAQIAALISGSAGAASTILKSTQTPYLVPGTGLVYNPQTGALSSGTAVNAGAISSSITPTIMIVAVLLLVLMSAKGGR